MGIKRLADPIAPHHRIGPRLIAISSFGSARNWWLGHGALCVTPKRQVVWRANAVVLEEYLTPRRLYCRFRRKMKLGLSFSRRKNEVSGTVDHHPTTKKAPVSFAFQPCVFKASKHLLHIEVKGNSSFLRVRLIY